MSNMEWHRVADTDELQEGHVMTVQAGSQPSSGRLHRTLTGLPFPETCPLPARFRPKAVETGRLSVFQCAFLLSIVKVRFARLLLVVHHLPETKV